MLINRFTTWINSLQDSKIPQRERMFRLLTTIGMIALLLAFVVGIFLEDNPLAVLVLLLGWVVMFSAIRITLNYGKLEVGIQLIATVLLFILIPSSFFTGGGLDGGAPIWFVFCAVYCSLLMSGPARNMFLLFTAIEMAGCYIIAYLYPDTVTEHTRLSAYLDSYAATLLLSGIICVLIVFQRNSYRQKSMHAEEQRVEIMELNKAQNRFFSSMSHEIRTPINTIIGLNEMNLRENLSDEVAENSVRIQEASRILLSLINDILDMSKIESGKMSIINAPYKLGDMLSEIVSMTWSAARDKHLTLNVDVDPTLPSEFIGDEVRIKQILINVINNSIKYTNEGSVTLTIQHITSPDKDNTTLSFIITDTGIGIKKESLPYLFNAFRREDEEKNRYIEGTGLGLSIVKQLVDLMDGRITVDSVYTQGSTFTILIPQKIADTTAIGELDFKNRSVTKSRKKYKQKFEAPTARVLIVDDNEVNLIVEEKLLRQTQVQIDTATSAKECLDMTLETRYDIIFMDHLMPEMDGVEALHILRNQPGGLNHDTTVIVLTANAGSDLVAMYKREGFDDVILKPVNGELLEDKVMAHLPDELLNVTYDETPTDSDDVLVRTMNRRLGIAVSTESVCDLPQQLINARGIDIIPYNIYTDDGYFQDGREIDTDGVLSHFIEADGTAYNKEPSVEEYEKFFASQLQKAMVLIHITASKKSSGAFMNAMEAAKMFENVVIIDSGHMSSSMGIMVYTASLMAEADESPDAIIKRMGELRKSLNTSFCLDSMKYLARSGRVPKRVLTISNAFMLHPIVEMHDGIMKPSRMLFGSRDSAWRRYISSAFPNPSGIDRRILFIAHSGLDTNELQTIERQVAEKIKFDRVIYQKVSASSSTIFGPGTFGLLYARKGA